MATTSKFKWHIVVFLAPAVLVYTAVMIFPLFNTLRLALYSEVDNVRVFVGFDNFRTLFGHDYWSEKFWNSLGNNLWFFVIHMLVQNPIGIVLTAILSHPKLRFANFYRTAKTRRASCSEQVEDKVYSSVRSVSSKKKK